MSSPYGGPPPGRSSFVPSAGSQADRPARGPGGPRGSRGPASPGAYVRPRHSGRTFRRSVSRALQWIFMDAVSARFGTLVIGLVLARMMGPAEFGAFGVVVIVAARARTASASSGLAGPSSAGASSPAEIAPTVMTISFSTSVGAVCGLLSGRPALPAAWAHLAR